MVARPGTIPALTPYQPNALPITGQELVEIASSNNATSAISASMLITDVVGKAPSALPNITPNPNDVLAIFQASSGLPKSCLAGSLGGGGGGVPIGGTTGQVLAKNSGTNFDTAWKSSGVPAGGTTGQVLTKNSGTDYDESWVTPAAGSVQWINVKNPPYNATGNGSTDDTTAINAAIAVLNTAGAGVLYFPFGTYKVTSSLTTITANCTVFGDGMATSDANGVLTAPISVINYTSNSTACMTITADTGLVRDLVFNYTGGSTPVAGCYGIVMNSAFVGSKINLERISTNGFYTNVNILVGSSWTMRDCFHTNAISGQVLIQNTVNGDSGDWLISGCVFSSGTNVHTSTHLQIESSGGAKIIGCKFNGNPPAAYDYGIVVNPNAVTSDLQVVGCSIENFTQRGIWILTSAWPNVCIIGNQFFTNVGQIGMTIAGATRNVSIIGNVFSGSINQGGIDLSGAGAGVTCVGNQTDPNTLSYSKLFANFPNNLPDFDASGGIGGTQFFKFTQSGGNISKLNWACPSGGGFIAGTLGVSSPATGSSNVIVTNDAGKNVGITMFSPTNGGPLPGAGLLSSDTSLILTSDNGVSSGGSDAISFRSGGSGSAAEVFQALPAGLLKLTNAANFTANGTTTSTIGATSPGHTAVQKWLTIQDSGGSTFYIPCF